MVATDSSYCLSSTQHLNARTDRGLKYPGYGSYYTAESYEQKWAAANKSRNRPKPPTQSQLSRLGVIIAIIAALVPWIPYACFRMSHRRALHSLSFVIDSRETSITNLQQTMETIDNVRGKLASIRVETNQLLVGARNQGRSIDIRNAEYLELEHVEESLLRRMDDLQAFIQMRSREAVKATHGYGPHKVEIELEGDRKLIVELFSSLVVPHAIEVFLGMVTDDSWKGLSFELREGDNTFKTTTINSKAAATVTRRLAFREYSENLPNHRKYTVGFSGRGPQFYINLADNGFRHVEDHDPCFGSVIAGQGALANIIENRENGPKTFAIKSMKLLEDDKQKPDVHSF